jgi:hypothetical protein
MFSKLFTQMVLRKRGLRVLAGLLAAAAVVGAGSMALNLRGQATGNEGTLNGEHCQYQQACTGTPPGLVTACDSSNENYDKACVETITYAKSGACTIPFYTGSCTFFLTPCFVYRDGHCDWNGEGTLTCQPPYSPFLDSRTSVASCQ